MEKYTEKDIIAGLMFVISWLADDYDHDSSPPWEEYVPGLYEKWRRDFYPERNSEHCGDCTRQCHTCIRCEVDNLYNIANDLINGKDIDKEKI